MALDDKKKRAILAQVELAQLQARLRDGDEAAIVEAKQMLHGLIDMSGTHQLTILLTAVECQASIAAAPKDDPPKESTT